MQSFASGDVSQVDIAELDATVGAFYSAGTAEQRSRAEQLLKKFQDHPDAWTRVDKIIDSSSSQQAKFFALQVLEEVIKYRWGALPDAQREGVRNWITNLIIKLSSDEATFRRERVFVNKLNITLVQVLKQDWPHKWQSFIPDLVGASKTSETLCENSMVILKLLSEEVFDFSRGELTQAKTMELKASLNTEFRLVHELCLFVLNAGARPDLVRATLQALHAYLSWVPLAYILDSNLVELLLQLLPQQPFRNAALQCLSEVAGLAVGPEYAKHYENLFRIFIGQLNLVLPVGTDVAKAYAAASDEEQAFVQNMALFLTAICRVHIATLEKDPQTLLIGLDYLLSTSFVDDDEVFKICLDYWNFFVPEVYTSASTVEPTPGLGPGPSSEFAFGGLPSAGQARKQLFSPVLSRLRTLMITRMAKPEEVIVVEDENGAIVRETMKDTDMLARYKTMHETLVYLSHLDEDDTEQQMLAKLRLQLNGKEWSWGALNTLCWAIGSISGSMLEEQEGRFLVTVIRDLLNLCEITRGKDNKAVIAANIMYVVGQYPRFLRNHWKFLKTVVNKLFEFMHETHPGVQDMACETFLKICHKCKRKFVIMQVGETEAFCQELLNQLSNIIQDLQTHQIHMFYEAVGLMISSEALPKRRGAYLEQLMAPPNATWKEVLGRARADPPVLREAAVLRNLANILQTNVAVCSALGFAFLPQLTAIFMDVLSVYRMYSELISTAVSSGQPHAARTSQVKQMRGVKRAALRLIETFVERSEDAQLLAEHFVPAMMDPSLGLLSDYARSVPDARDAEVLSLFAAVITKLQRAMEAEVPRIFEAVFECTLQMITQNFEDYPEHRLHFFALLRAIVNNCYATLLAMSPAQLKLTVDSIVWAMRHTERNVAETGLHLLLELLQRMEGGPAAASFYGLFYLHIQKEVFAVMTDTFHKPGLKMQARILHHLFTVVAAGGVSAPLWDAAALGPAAFPSNAAFVAEHTQQLLATSFPNLLPQQIKACVAGMLELRDFTAFKQHLRDFLVQTKCFADKDNADLYAEEAERQRQAERKRLAAIPGMLNPNEVPAAEEVMGE